MFDYYQLFKHNKQLNQLILKFITKQQNNKILQYSKEIQITYEKTNQTLKK
jgi:hypothetical protein